jgi:hypothetical protein
MPNPMSIQEFSGKIKSKYPEYNDIDDATLAQKIVSKYPVYKNSVDLGGSDVLAPAKQNFAIVPNSEPKIVAPDEQPSVHKTTHDILYDKNTPSIDNTKLDAPITLAQDAINPVNQTIDLADTKAKIDPTNSNPRIDEDHPAVLDDNFDRSMLSGAVNSTNALGGSIEGTIGDYANKMSSMWGNSKALKDVGTFFTNQSNAVSNQVKQTDSEYSNEYGKAIGGVVPMAIATVADVYSGGTLTPAITGSFAASGYGDGIRAYDDIKKENNEQGNEFARTGAGLGYSAVMLGTMNALGSIIGSKGAIALSKTPIVGDAISDIFKSNPGTFEGGAKELFENYAKSQPSTVSRLVKAGLGNLATMEGMEGSKLAINAMAGQNQSVKQWVDTAASAAVSSLLFTAIAPFSMNAQDEATLARRTAQKDVTISMNNGKPVELIETQGGWKGLTPDNKLVDVDQSAINNSFQIETNHFYDLLDKFKSGQPTDQDLKRNVFSNRVKSVLNNFQTSEGNVQTITDSEGNRNYISRVDKDGNIIGVNGNGETSNVGQVQTPNFEVGQDIPQGRITNISDSNLTIQPPNTIDENNNPIQSDPVTIPISTFSKTIMNDANSKWESANIADVHKSIMDKYDEVNGQKQTTNNQPTLPSPEEVKAQQDQTIAEARQKAAAMVTPEINPDTNSIIYANVDGESEPVRITKGVIRQNPDGTIDETNSDKQVYYTDNQGNKQVAPIGNIAGVTENTPSEQAIQNAQDHVAGQLSSTYANQAVRPYNPGEVVRIDHGNGTFTLGTIEGTNQDGTYLFKDQQGLMANIEPRAIVNEDNIAGVQNGEQVSYTDASGQLKQGEYQYDPTDKEQLEARAEGLVQVDDTLVPISSIKKVGNPIPEPVITADNTAKDSTSELKPNVSEEEKQIPEDKEGNMLFEQAPVDKTISALNEIFDSPEEVQSTVDAKIKEIQDQIKKTSTYKPTGDIQKDIQTKKDMKTNSEVLNSQLDYWNGVNESLKPKEEVISKMETPENNQEEVTPIDNKVEEAVKENKEKAIEGIDNQIQSQEPNLNPTEAQKEAGNYKMAHITFQGMDISIENPKGSIRSGISEDGKKWSNEMFSNYGYFKGTEGKDGDHIDCFVGPDENSKKVFVIDQVFTSGDKSGLFDESKVMLGYNTAGEAESAYMKNYDKNWMGLSDITEVGVEDFKKWLYDGAKQRKPFAEYKDTPSPINSGKQEIDSKINEPKQLSERYNDSSPEERHAIAKEIVTGLEKLFKTPVKAKVLSSTNDFLEAIKPLISDSYFNEALNMLSDGETLPGVRLSNKIFINVEHNPSYNELIDTWLHEQAHESTKKAFTQKQLSNLEINNVDSYIPSQYHDQSIGVRNDEAISHVIADLLKKYTPEQIKNGEIELSLPKDIKEPVLKSLNILTNGKYKGSIENIGRDGLVETNDKFENQGGVLKPEDAGNDLRTTVETNKPVETERERKFREIAEKLKKGLGLDEPQYKKLAKTIIVDGQPRPTTNNLGKPIHSTEEGVRNFWKWFGDSKVVDESGRPLVVYHGTTNYDEFNKFRRGSKGYVGGGIYFSSIIDNAKSYARKYGSQGHLYEEYLSIQNPLVVKGSIGADDLLKQLYGTESIYKNRSNKQSFDTMIVKRSDINKLQDKGYDGIIWTTADEYISWEPTQIKSATENNGEFDENNSDIRYKRLSSEVNDLALDMSEMLFEDGDVSFPDYSAKMIDTLGEGIKPYLKGFYELSRASIPQEGMSSPVDVAKFDIQQFNHKDHVSNRSGRGQSNSPDNKNEIPTDAEVIPNDGGTGGSVGNEPANNSGKGIRQSGRKSGSGLFTDLFGESGYNELHQEIKEPELTNSDAGDFDGRGNELDSESGHNDIGRSPNESDRKDNSSVPETFKERTARLIQEQIKAEPIPVKLMDEDNIRETLPLLLPEQQDDVLKAENRFFGEKHKTSQAAHGKGMLFTNGTGTGKTYSGLGIAKRFAKQGKKNILIVVPSEPKINDWVSDGRNIGLDITPILSTKDKGKNAVITTYANFRSNNALKTRDFDLVMYDESHRLMEEKSGKASSTTYTHYETSNVTKQQAFNRIQSVDPHYLKLRELQEEREHGVEPSEEEKKLQEQYDTKIKPKLEERAQKAFDNTKVVFLSATPFKGHFNLRYANHSLFDWGDETTYEQKSVGMSRVNPEGRFFMDNFGSAYEWKNNQLQSKSKANAEAIAMQEVEFADKLMAQGAMSGRALESDKDYSREFPLVALDHSEDFNKAFNDIFNYRENPLFKGLNEAAREVFYDYNYTTKLLESLRASMVIPRIQDHLDLGRKVVVFHRRKQANVAPPFQMILDNSLIKAHEKMGLAIASAYKVDEAKENLENVKNQIEDFKIKYSELLKFEQTLNYDPAIDQLNSAFPGKVVFINGDTAKKDKSGNIVKFNDDNSGKDIIVIQEEAGKEGISLHDTSGEHQRVLINLSLPISSTTALQIEGRVYRIGQATNAVFENPLLGLDMEIADFGQKINKKLSTTENLAIGSQARDLLRSFAEGVLFNSGKDKPNKEQGVGGKEYDKKATQLDMTEFKKAMLIYDSNQKNRGSRDSRQGKDYYATAEPLGQKMVEWLDINPGESVMEPSAGHGAIAMWFPEKANATVIEPSYSLFSKLNARAGGGNRKIINDIFENHNVVNKYHGIAMNPPFGSGGKTAIDHVEKAFEHLHNNGRIVAIIPQGQADKRLDKFLNGEDDKGKLLHPTAHLIASIKLPSIAFEQAGTAINTRIVVIDKIEQQSEFSIKQEIKRNNPYILEDELTSKVQTELQKQLDSIPRTENIDLSDSKNVNDLFSEIEDMNITPRSGEKQVIEHEPIPEVSNEVSETSNYDVFDQNNSKTGEAMFMAKSKKSISDYKATLAIAKKHGGNYSSYQNKADNIQNGFFFKNPDNRQKFLDEVENKQESPTYKRSTLINKPDYKDYDGDVLKFSEDTVKYYEELKKGSKKEAKKADVAKEKVEGMKMPKVSDYAGKSMSDYRKAKQEYFKEIQAINNSLEPAEKKRHRIILSGVKEVKDEIVQNDIPELRKLYNEIENDWFGNKDVENAKAMSDTIKLQTKLKDSVKGTDVNWKDIDKAIHIYNDMKNDPEAYKKYYPELTDEQKRIADIAQNLTPEQIEVADKINEEYVKLGQSALDEEVIGNIIDNYVRRTWDLSGGENTKDFWAKFSTSTSHAKQRKLGSILEGQAGGLNLKTAGATNNLQALRDEIHAVIANKQLMNAGLKTFASNGVPLFRLDNETGYKEIKHPNFRKWVQQKNVDSSIDLRGENWAVDKDGKIFEKKKVYAPAPIADKLNNVLGESKLNGLPFIDGLTKFNAIAKTTMLSFSFYHHQAFTRAYLFAASKENIADSNPMRAYKAGLDMFMNMSPEVETLIRNGMTLGRVQDWQEDLVEQKNFITKILDKAKVTKSISDKIMDLHKTQTDFLFKQFGLGLKVKSGVLEYNKQVQMFPDEDPNLIAKRVGEMMNNLFGGLNLERMGRNKTMQHLTRLTLLATDWTESNIKTLVKAFGWDYSKEQKGSKDYEKHERQMYQKVLGKSLLKSALTSTFWSLAIAAPWALLNHKDSDAEDTYWNEVEKLYTKIIQPLLNFDWDDASFLTGFNTIRDFVAKSHFLDADITPINESIHKLLGKEMPENEEDYFSILGHFKDPIKWIIDPATSLKHKASIMTSIALDGLTGKDWQGKRFTTIDELLGIDDKGLYARSIPKKGIHIGDPKGGRMTGEFTKYGKPYDTGAVQINEMPSFLLSEIRRMIPVPIQGITNMLQGEMDGFTAMTRGLGFNVSSEKMPNPNDIKVKAVEAEVKNTNIILSGIQEKANELYKSGADPLTISEQQQKFMKMNTFKHVVQERIIKDIKDAESDMKSYSTDPVKQAEIQQLIESREKALAESKDLSNNPNEVSAFAEKNGISNNKHRKPKVDNVVFKKSQNINYDGDLVDDAAE